MNTKERLNNVEEWLKIINEAMTLQRNNVVDLQATADVDLVGIRILRKDVQDLKESIDEIKCDIATIKLIQIISLKQGLNKNEEGKICQK